MKDLSRAEEEERLKTESLLFLQVDIPGAYPGDFGYEGSEYRKAGSPPRNVFGRQAAGAVA